MFLSETSFLIRIEKNYVIMSLDILTRIQSSTSFRFRGGLSYSQIKSFMLKSK